VMKAMPTYRRWLHCHPPPNSRYFSQQMYEAQSVIWLN
jgi:hypothetical protein